MSHMTRPHADPQPKRRLIVTYQIQDGESKMECRKVVSHELLDAARRDVRGAMLWHHAEDAIRESERAWAEAHGALAE